MKFEYLKNLGAIALCLGIASVCAAQNAPGPSAPDDQTAQAPATPAAPAPAAPAAPAPAAPAAPAPLSTPAITGPLSNLPPLIFDSGPVGKIAVNGILSGYGLVQSNPVPGDKVGQASVTNGQVFIQKADGRFQFYIQAGAYDIPALGTPFLSTEKTLSDLYGPLPVAFGKIQVAKNTSVQFGLLPTLIGAEYTFSFENMNINRGLLWNQENAITRGVQVNQTMGKVTASASWGDGFYSDRYSWITGSLTYTSGPNALAFVAGGNLSQTKFQSVATPVQNNGSIYNVIYTYTKGSWIVQPYLQFSNIPTNASIGVVKGASTSSGAILLSYAMKHGVSVPVRWEYISTSGTAANNAVNLLYGPGSNGLSVTVSPTYQAGGFFARTDLSWVHTGNFTPGDAFGAAGNLPNQTRAAFELGFIFGSNITEKK